MNNNRFKFRAWHIDHMVYIDDEETILQFKNGKWVVCSPVWEMYYAKEEKGDILMQSTGLHDKNGREIFEGDVFKTDTGDIVEVDDLVKGNFIYLEYHEIGEWNITNGEVIGNKFEHDYLLNETK